MIQMSILRGNRTFSRSAKALEVSAKPLSCSRSSISTDITEFMGRACTKYDPTWSESSGISISPTSGAGRAEGK